MRKCENCGINTKNQDKKGNCPKCSKELREKGKHWEDCICGHENVHNPECKRNHRKNFLHYHSTVVRKALRKERVKKRLCAGCGNKVKPKVIYPYRCECCQDKIKEYTERRKENG